MELAKVTDNLKEVVLQLWHDTHGVRIEGVQATSQAVKILDELDDEAEEFKCQLVEKGVHRRCY